LITLLDQADVGRAPAPARAMYQAAPESEKHKRAVNVPIVGLVGLVPQRWAGDCSKTAHNLMQSVETRALDVALPRLEL